MSRLLGRTALVTGATGGIGSEIASTLAKEGAEVLLTGRDETRGNEVASSIQAAGGKATFIAADLGAGGAAVRRLADEAIAAAGGPIGILVNCAAFIVMSASVVDVTEETLDQALATNVKVPFLLTAALVPGMAALKGGSVINIGAVTEGVGMVVHSTTKGALHSMTRSLAGELGPKGIRVNAVAPGPTLTSGNEGFAAILQQITAEHPARRAGRAADVAAAVAFLASDEAAHIYGAVLPVDGGGLTRFPVGL